MNSKIIFAMLKNEVIPIKEEAFLDAMEDILNGCVGQETVVKLLESSFRVEDNEILKFLSVIDTGELVDEVAKLYQVLVDKRHVKFGQSIEKKLKPREWEGKEAKLRAEDEKIRESYKGYETEMIKVDDIKLLRQMKGLLPNSRKMMLALDYYKNNKEFNDSIFLDKHNYLLEGLKSYYLCKMLSVTEVMVYKKRINNELDME